MARVEALDNNFEQFVGEVKWEIRTVKKNQPLPLATIPTKMVSTPGNDNHPIREVRGLWWVNLVTLSNPIELDESFPNRVWFNPISSDSDSDVDSKFNYGHMTDVREQRDGDFKIKLDIPYFDKHLHIEDYLTRNKPLNPTSSIWILLLRNKLSMPRANSKVGQPLGGCNWLKQDSEKVNVR